MMKKVNKPALRNIIIVSLLVAIAYLCRLPQIHIYSPAVFGYTRSFIYLSLFSLLPLIVKGNSLRKTLLQILIIVAGVVLMYLVAE